MDRKEYIDLVKSSMQVSQDERRIAAEKLDKELGTDLVKTLDPTLSMEKRTQIFLTSMLSVWDPKFKTLFEKTFGEKYWVE